MPPVTPNYDLGPLITIDISIGLLTVLAIMIGVWGIMRQNLRSQEISERVAGHRGASGCTITQAVRGYR